MLGGAALGGARRAGAKAARGWRAAAAARRSSSSSSGVGGGATSWADAVRLEDDAALPTLEARAPQGAAAGGEDRMPKPSFEQVQISGPHLWFKRARALQRKVIMHVGPTNSGKTYRALQALKTAQTGVYASPLRLLAWQISQELDCTLITGQERMVGENANVTSCTVEMTPLVDVVDVGVVDEFQLMGDRHRGWAFSRAVLGLPARELHLCGEEGAVELVRKMCALTGDELEVNYYERLSPLEADPKPIAGYEDVRPGDCVIAFSRREIHKIRDKIERLSGHKCAVVYGGLPPEIRKQQATAFNSPSSNRNILVATDAVGMGLNLTVKRVIFSKMEKFDGQVMRKLTLREVKQIAGRAGRFGRTEEATGCATALNETDLKHIRLALPHAAPVISCGYVFPPREFVRARFHNICVDKLEAIREVFVSTPVPEDFVESKGILESSKSALVAEEREASGEDEDGASRSKKEIMSEVHARVRGAKEVVLRYQEEASHRVASVFNDALVQVMKEIEEASQARSELMEKRVQIEETIAAGAAAREDPALTDVERERAEAKARNAERALAEVDSQLQGDRSGDFLQVQHTKALRSLIAEMRDVALDVDTVMQVCNAPIDASNAKQMKHVRRYLRLTHERSVRLLVASLDDPFLDEFFAPLYRYEEVAVADDWAEHAPRLVPDRVPDLDERRFLALEPKRPASNQGKGFSLERRMQDYEQYYTMLDLSSWLAHRFEHPPDQIQKLGALKASCLNLLEQWLQGTQRNSGKADLPRRSKRVPPQGRTRRIQRPSSPSESGKERVEQVNSS